MQPEQWMAENGPGGDAGAFVVRPRPYRPRWWLHAALLAATLLTTTYFGALFAGDLPDDIGSTSLLALALDPRVMTEGLKFSLPLLFILLCHEMGHYLACRLHGLAATPPFFLPAPLLIPTPGGLVPVGIGTFGAVIRIKEPVRNKLQLLDVGVAGPLAGFVALVPFLLYGVWASRVTEIPVDEGYILFGEPLAFRLAARMIHPAIGGELDLVLHPTGFAAWIGLLITALNLLPFAQLDGGHITYAMFGRLHRIAVWPLLGLLVGLGFLWPGWWVWAVIALVMGVRHPRIWDEDQPLDRRRTTLGWIALVVLVLCFVPEPITIVP